MLLAGPAAGQSSLGGQQNLAPPQPAAPSAPASPTPPRSPAASTQRPAATTGTPPHTATTRGGTPQAATTRGSTPQAATTSGGTHRTAPRSTSRSSSTSQTRAATPATPTVRPPPGASATGAAPARPRTGQATTPPRRRGAAPAAAAGAAAAGAAAVARPAHPAPAPEPPAPRLGSATNLPLPRYAALGSNQVNLRVGPDLRYPIEWTYQRKDLPVQIIDEHQLWRRIRDPEGTEGWVQRPLLTSRRSFLIPAGAERVLRRRAEEGAAEVARLRPGVVGRIRHCEPGSAWCEVQVGDYRGYIRRTEIWGVTADEAVN